MVCSAAKVGAVATNDARYLAALTNIPTLQQVTAMGASTTNAVMFGSPIASLPAPLAHWKMNDNAANTSVSDCSGHSLNLTAAQNSSVLSTTGKINTALNFNGTTDIIHGPVLGLPTGTGTRSMCSWVNFSTASGDRIVCGWGAQSSAQSFYINQYNGGYRLVMFGGDVSAGTTTTGQWVFLAATYDGTKACLYLNGVLAGTLVRAINTSSTDFYIGNYANASALFSGSIDDVRLYTNLLTAAQITILYNNGIGTESDNLTSGGSATFDGNGNLSLTGLLTVNSGINITGPVTGITAAQVGGAVSTSDVRYLAALTNASQFATAAQGAKADNAAPASVVATQVWSTTQYPRALLDASAFDSANSAVIATAGLSNAIPGVVGGILSTAMVAAITNNQAAVNFNSGTFQSLNSISTTQSVTAVQQTASGSHLWYSIASSADGSKLIAIDYGATPVFRSTNSGAAWAPVSGAGGYQVAVASSADGMKLAIAEMYGYGIYTSTNGAASWSARGSFGNSKFEGVASSADGTRLAVYTAPIAQTCDNWIYTSTNSGFSWVQRLFATNKTWVSIAASSNGMVLIAGADNDYLYVSRDGGVTWTTQLSAGSNSWSAVAVSANGTKFVACAFPGYIYTSIDCGYTWTLQQAAGADNWQAIACSYDGTKLAAAAWDGYIYISQDGGSTWLQVTAAGAAQWSSIVASADGTKFAATAYGGYIWTITVTPPTPINVNGALAVNGNAVLTSMPTLDQVTAAGNTTANDVSIDRANFGINTFGGALVVLGNNVQEGVGTSAGSNGVVGTHAAGQNAHADHENTFVWSDGTPVHSTSNRQFTVCATNGIILMGGSNQFRLGGTGAAGGATLGNSPVITRDTLSQSLQSLDPLTLNNVTVNGSLTLAGSTYNHGVFYGGSIDGSCFDYGRIDSSDIVSCNLYITKLNGITDNSGATISGGALNDCAAALIRPSTYHNSEIATLYDLASCLSSANMHADQDMAMADARVDSQLNAEDLQAVTSRRNTTTVGIDVVQGDLTVEAGTVKAPVGGAYVKNLGDIQMGQFAAGKQPGNNFN